MSSDFELRISEAIRRIRAPIDDLDELTLLLRHPLECLETIPPPSFREIHRYLPQIQQLILTSVVPVWEAQLKETGYFWVLSKYFALSMRSRTQITLLGFIASHAYRTIMSNTLETFSLEVLAQLLKQFSINECYDGIFDNNSDLGAVSRAMMWEECVGVLLSLPDKVANATSLENQFQRLQHSVYLSEFCQSAYLLFCDPVATPDQLEHKQFLLQKMILRGLFPLTRSDYRGTISFFKATEMSPHRMLSYDVLKAFGTVVASLTSSFQQRIVLSFMANISLLKDPLEVDNDTVQLIRRQAALFQLFDEAAQDRFQFSEILCWALDKLRWNIGLGRIVLFWLEKHSKLYSRSISHKANDLVSVLNHLHNAVLNIWTSSQHIQHSLSAQHQGLSTMLLLSVAVTGNVEDQASRLSITPQFIEAIGIYLSHLDPSTRRCGMLVAEVVAHWSGRTLDFGNWEGEDEGRHWARRTRSLIGNIPTLDENSLFTSETVHPINVARAEVSGDRPTIDTINDSDDSLSGYSSELSADDDSITSADLKAMETDITLRSMPKKLRPPVYIAQLLELLRSVPKTDEYAEMDRHRIALLTCDSLIRRKRNFGTELDENATELAHILVGLQDNYGIERFEILRQSSLVALVACAPRKAALAVIEDFFIQTYSIDQRCAMLNALASGARELAGLNSTSIADQDDTFPSRMLTGQRHNKYIQAAATSKPELRSIMDQVRERPNDNPGLRLQGDLTSRYKQLRISSHLVKTKRSGEENEQTQTSFKSIAAEYFIVPLINNFWTYLNAEQMREQRTRYWDRPYNGVGTAMIQHPLLLNRFIKTLNVLLYAAHNSSAFQAILAPDALELAVALGARPLFISTESDGVKEAEVLLAVLELSLNVLTTCIELDGGKYLCSEYPAIFMGVKELASQTMHDFNSGIRLPGGSSNSEAVLGTSVALSVKIEEILKRWQRSMVNTLLK